MTLVLTGAWFVTLRDVRFAPLEAVALFVALLAASVLWDLTVVGLTMRTLALGVMVGAVSRSGLRRVAA